MTRADIVAEARTWIGVPFHHQGRSRQGTDCGGLIGAVGIACGSLPSTWWSDVFDPQFSGYARIPSNGTLQRICDSYMTRVENIRPGDVVLMRFKTEPQHLGIVADYVHGGLSLIHALSSAGRVAEHRFAPEWRKRIVATYCLPGVH